MAMTMNAIANPGRRGAVVGFAGWVSRAGKPPKHDQKRRKHHDPDHFDDHGILRGGAADGFADGDHLGHLMHRGADIDAEGRSRDPEHAEQQRIDEHREAAEQYHLAYRGRRLVRGGAEHGFGCDNSSRSANSAACRSEQNRVAIHLEPAEPHPPAHENRRSDNEQVGGDRRGTHLKDLLQAQIEPVERDADPQKRLLRELKSRFCAAGFASARWAIFPSKAPTRMAIVSALKPSAATAGTRASRKASALMTTTIDKPGHSRCAAPLNAAHFFDGGQSLGRRDAHSVRTYQAASRSWDRGTC